MSTDKKFDSDLEYAVLAAAYQDVRRRSAVTTGETQDKLLDSADEIAKIVSERSGTHD